MRGTDGLSQGRRMAASFRNLDIIDFVRVVFALVFLLVDEDVVELDERLLRVVERLPHVAMHEHRKLAPRVRACSLDGVPLRLRQEREELRLKLVDGRVDDTLGRERVDVALLLPPLDSLLPVNLLPD